MPILRVEELEQRRVLSGGLSHATAPAHPTDYNGSSLQASSGGFADAGRLTINFGSPSSDATTIVLLVGNSFRPMFVIAIETIVFVHMPAGAPDAPTIANMDPGRASAALSAVPVNADVPPILNANSTAQALKAVAQQPALTNTAPVTPAFVAPRFATPILTGPTSGRTGELIVPTPSIVPPNPGGGGGVVETEAKVETAPAKPGPVPMLLSILPTVEIAGFSRGIRQFLSGVKAAAAKVTEEASGLREWIVAGVAAAAACEIARRQLRRQREAADRVIELPPLAPASE